MSYKIRQIPNLLFSDYSFSCFNTLNLPPVVKENLRSFLLRLNQFDWKYIDAVVEKDPLVTKMDGFLIFQIDYETQYYSLLLKEKRILSLYIKDEQGLSKEDCEEGRLVMMQEDWE